METIALTGTYDDEIKAMLSEMLPAGFRLKHITSVQEYEQLQDVNYIILRILSLQAQDINAIPNLKLIQRWGVGYDKVDIKAAGARNVQVAVTSGVNAVSVSEMTVLLMLAVYRQLVRLHADVTAGNWQAGGLGSTCYTLDGKLVGLVGMGAIGRLVAKTVQAFGARVQYYDMFRLPEQEETELGIAYADKEELFRHSDIVSLHVPLNDNTRHLIDQSVFAIMKPTAILINTSRGSIVNEGHLLQALKAKQILGVGLDCLEQEPAGKDNPLFGLERVIVTPHMGGSTHDINLAMAKRCIGNIINVSKGVPLAKTDLVNAAYLTT